MSLAAASTLSIRSSQLPLELLGLLLELSELELLFGSLGVSARGAGPGMVGGVLGWPRHHAPIHTPSGKGLELRCFFLDCCLCISAMMSSTGRSAGHAGGADCANIAMLTPTTATAYRICMKSL